MECLRILKEYMMAGIDNITNGILQEAKAKADELIREAREKAEAAESEAREEAKAEAEKIAGKAAKDAENYAERIASQAAMQKRQAILGAKQSVIENMIKAAYEKLSGQETGEYFSMIAKLLAGKITSGAGELLFSGKDLARLPEGFRDLVKKLAAEKGGSLTIGEESADIENGFILRYGGVDENCSLSSLFAEKKDMLQDLVSRTLW